MAMKFIALRCAYATLEEESISGNKFKRFHFLHPKSF